MKELFEREQKEEIEKDWNMIRFIKYAVLGALSTGTSAVVASMFAGNSILLFAVIFITLTLLIAWHSHVFS